MQQKYNVLQYHTCRRACNVRRYYIQELASSRCHRPIVRDRLTEATNAVRATTAATSEVDRCLAWRDRQVKPSGQGSYSRYNNSAHKSTVLQKCAADSATLNDRMCHRGLKSTQAA